MKEEKKVRYSSLKKKIRRYLEKERKLLPAVYDCEESCHHHRHRRRQHPSQDDLEEDISCDHRLDFLGYVFSYFSKYFVGLSENL